MRKLCLQGTFVDIDGKIKIKQQKKFAPLTKTGFAQIAVSFVPCTITFNLHFIMHKQTKNYHSIVILLVYTSLPLILTFRCSSFLSIKLHCCPQQAIQASMNCAPHNRYNLPSFFSWSLWLGAVWLSTDVSALGMARSISNPKAYIWIGGKLRDFGDSKNLGGDFRISANNALM